MGDLMLRYCQSLVFLCAVLLLAWLGTLRAAEEQPEVPVGYAEAAAPKEKESQQQAIDADLPIGYQDASQAGTRKKKKARRPAQVPEAAQPVRDAKAIAQEKKIIAANPQLQAIVAQMRKQLQPFFAVELTFAKNVCQATPEQVKKMKVLAKPALEQVLQSLAIQQGGQRGLVRAWGGRQQQPKDILEQFEVAASRIVTEIFPPETVAIYQDEQRHRAEFRAKAGAMALVAHLDTKLRFNSRQREYLTDSLQSQWRRSWQRYLQIMDSNPQFFPPVPDQAIVPHLNGVQVKQWKNRQRQDLGFHWQNLNMNQGQFRNMKQEVDWFEEPGKPEENAEMAEFAAVLIEQDVALVLKEAVEAEEEEQEK